MIRKTVFWFSLLLPLLILIPACEMVLPGPAGIIEFPDYTEQRIFIGGNAGLMDFEGKTVELGARKIIPLNIKNSGEGPLKIINLHILQTAVPDTNPAGALEAFRFVEGTFPVIPLIIPSGQTVNDIFIEFAPETAGDFRGKLFVETESDSSFIDLAGTGLWQLKVNGDADGILYILADNPADTVVIDGAGASGTATSSDGVFTILCEPVFMREHQKWDPDGADIEFPTAISELEFGNRKALKTVVTLKDHSAISADIENPFEQVSPGEDLQAAINTCAADLDALPIAVVLSAGTHNFTDITINAGVPIYGGYNSGWTARAYESAADRNNIDYKTTINLSGTLTVTGSAVMNNTAIEGLTINRTGASNAPLIKFDSGTTAELRYNTITGGGTGSAAAVLITNGSAPLIKYNYIAGGTTSAAYSESYGIMITEKAAPVIYKNSITGGTAGGEGSQSFGIFCDFETEPLIRNNTPLSGEPWGISGGSAPGSGGKSYGIYIINNGNAQVYYNSINGGSGSTAVGLFSKYGSYIDAGHNNIFTSGGDLRLGIWADHMGRVYYLKYNGLYDCSTALYKDSYSGNLTDIDAVNSKFNTGTNTNEAVDLSDAPSEVDYE